MGQILMIACRHRLGEGDKTVCVCVCVCVCSYKKLPLERIWDRYLVIHVGEHNGLEGCAGSTNLYHALNRYVIRSDQIRSTFFLQLILPHTYARALLEWILG